jgi:transposase
MALDLFNSLKQDPQFFSDGLTNILDLNVQLRPLTNRAYRVHFLQLRVLSKANRLIQFTELLNSIVLENLSTNDNNILLSIFGKSSITIFQRAFNI